MFRPDSHLHVSLHSRPVVDLPQPDSPTIPTVSPLAMANETSSTARTVLRAANRSPRTGKCFVSPVTCNSGCAAPPRSSIGVSISANGVASFMASVPDIHGAAHAIAQQIEADRHRKDHRPWKCRDPRIDIDRRAQGVEHQAPFRLRWFGAEAEK